MDADTVLAERNELILNLIPKRYREITNRYFMLGGVEELRFRVNRPAQLIFSDKDVLLSQYGMLSKQEADDMLTACCMGSVYACENELRQGFITLSGGIRVGLSGNPVMTGGRITNFTSVGGFNIRIPNEVHGCADDLADMFIEDGLPVSALVASPPGVGKTTLLRDLARSLSNRGYRVGIADERNELSGSMNSVPMFDVGLRTDIISFVPKTICIPMLIRSMSPQVIITDELSGEDEMNGVSEALKHGVAIIASIHASSFRQLRTIAYVGEALSGGLISRAFILRRSGSRFSLIGEGEKCD